MYGSHKIPQQRLPLTKKTKKWREECIDAFINLSKFGLSERRNYLKSLYDYYNGEIDAQDYKYVLKPYGKSRENFPSKLRNYPIIKPIIDLLLGEKSKRPLNYTVGVTNSDSISIKEEEKRTKILKTVEQMFLQQVQDPENPLPPEQIQLPKQLVEEFETSYRDKRAINGQNALDFIMQHQEIYDKLQKLFFHDFGIS